VRIFADAMEQPLREIKSEVSMLERTV